MMSRRRRLTLWSAALVLPGCTAEDLTTFGVDLWRAALAAVIF